VWTVKLAASYRFSANAKSHVQVVHALLNDFKCELSDLLVTFDNILRQVYASLRYVTSCLDDDQF
jgi:hypothetical protein